jgi:hypothetical protein
MGRFSYHPLNRPFAFAQERAARTHFKEEVMKDG